MRVFPAVNHIRVVTNVVRAEPDVVRKPEHFLEIVLLATSFGGHDIDGDVIISRKRIAGAISARAQSVFDRPLLH
jgi:hypothetical protein